MLFLREAGAMERPNDRPPASFCALALLLSPLALAPGQDSKPAAGGVLIRPAWLSSVGDVAVSPDGKHVAAVGTTSWFENRHQMKLFDAATGREVRSFDLKGSAAHSPAFSPDGKRI